MKRSSYEDHLEAQKTPHEWVPYQLTEDDPVDHVCKGSCACNICALEWRNKVHTNRPTRGKKRAIPAD